jgi:hypothetical protein
MPVPSWRFVTLTVLVLAGGAAACARKPPPPDPAFEARWQAATSASEAVVIGDEAGEALAANVRRAARPKLDQPAAPRAAGALPIQPRGDEVDRVIRSNLAGIKGCYQSVARRGSGRSGKAIVSFSIGSDGRPSNVRVEAPTFADTALPTCMTAQVAFWSFPRSQKGGGVVSYPFVFVGG